MRLREIITWANPWAAVWVRLEIADVLLALADPDGARTLLREVDDIVYHRPKLGTLNTRVDDLRVRLAKWPTDAVGSTLSAAELRLLPYLQTHLSLKQIGDRLFVSRNTVGTEVASIYRKLGASGRSEAVDRARDLGLLAPSAL
jgi:LuxR family maltose regulon positive regulatory protein